MVTVIYHDAVDPEIFPGGAAYQTLVGDDAGSTPVRCGIQTSPPGYATPNHAHPYVEIVTVLEGSGEAWIDGEADAIKIGPGMTVVFPKNTAHGFRVIGDTPLVTYGIHSSPDRIIEIRN